MRGRALNLEDDRLGWTRAGYHVYFPFYWRRKFNGFYFFFSSDLYFPSSRLRLPSGNKIQRNFNGRAYAAIFSQLIVINTLPNDERFWKAIFQTPTPQVRKITEINCGKYNIDKIMHRTLYVSVHIHLNSSKKNLVIGINVQIIRKD